MPKVDSSALRQSRKQTNLTDFQVSNVLPVAQKIVDAAERVYLLTERDTK